MNSGRVPEPKTPLRLLRFVLVGSALFGVAGIYAAAFLSLVMGWQRAAHSAVVLGLCAIGATVCVGVVGSFLDGG